MIKLGKKTTATLLIAIFMISMFTVAMPIIAQTTPTIDGVIGLGEWGEVDFSGSDYDVYVLNDADYLYIAFEAEGGDFTIASSMTNIYIYAGDDYAGECWAYTVAGWVEDVGLDHFTIHHIQPPKVKEGKEAWPTNAEISISTTVMEWKIPLDELPMNPGDTIAFDFMSFSEGSSSWSTAWLYGQYHILWAPPPPDTTAPVVTLDSPTDGSFVSGIVDIYGTVTEDVALSHYNIAIYPGDADFNDFNKRLEQETVYRSSGFENLLIYHWDTTKYDDGEYLIRLAARDAAGNRDLSGNPYSGGDDSQHVIRVTVDNVPTKATVDINPDTLNLKSDGQWITAYIELPEGYSVEDIDVGSINLEGSVLVDPEAPTAIGDYDDDGVPDLMVKFDRQALKEAISGLVDVEVTGDVKFFLIELTITGKVAGTSFAGTDSIKVIRK